MGNTIKKIGYMAGIILLPILGIYGKNTITSDIPGIDSIPAAKSSQEYIDSKKNNNSTENDALDREKKKVNTIAGKDNKDQMDDSNLKLPLISDLKATVYSSRKYSVKLEWKVSPKNTTAIYVARYVRPIANRELVLDADVVSSPPLDPKTTSFIDYNIPDGTYYYVVVTSFEMSTKKRLKLTAKGNYTIKPSIIYRKSYQPEVVQPDYRINGLYAVNVADSVLLSWAPAKAANIKYNIYKSYLPMGDDDSLKYAKKLGSVKYNTLQFTDNAPVINRPTYYLITVVDLSSNQEHTSFELNKTLVKNTFIKKKYSTEKLKLLPSALTPYQKSNDTIQLLWVDPEIRIPEFSIYRASRPISSVDAVRKATLVGHVPYGSKLFNDPGLKPGIYYYAVLPKQGKRKLIGIFLPGRTFTSFPVKLSMSDNSNTNNTNNTNINNTTDNTTETDNNQSSNVKISLFTGKRISDKRIKLEWEIKTNDQNKDNTDYHFLLYRSTKPLSSFEQVQKDAEFITELGSSQKSFVDHVSKNNRYYYALLLDFNGKIRESMIAGRNYLRKPIVVDSAKVTDVENNIGKKTDNNKNTDLERRFKYTMSGLNRTLADTYHRNGYNSAITQIAIYKNSLYSPPRVRAKATLYTGMSWYRLGRYQTAMEYFLNSKVRKYYPERSRFWYKRCIERSG